MDESNSHDDGSGGEVMTISDVARYLRLSEAKVYQLARNGTIPALRIGKSWRVQKDLLVQWVRKNAEANIGETEKNLLDRGA